MNSKQQNDSVQKNKLFKSLADFIDLTDKNLEEIDAFGKVQGGCGGWGYWGGSCGSCYGWSYWGGSCGSCGGWGYWGGSCESCDYWGGSCGSCGGWW